MISSRLTYQKKNYLLIVGVVFLALLSWRLAFRKTFEAVGLNNRLNTQISDKADVSYNPSYLKEKDKTLEILTRRFSIDTAEWENEFWLKASRMAVMNDANVIYNPAAVSMSADTVSHTKRQSITFEGDFKKLVRLIDTLEKTENIGYLSSLSFTTETKNRTSESPRLYLKTVFTIIKK